MQRSEFKYAVIDFPFPALPVVFKEELKNEEVLEGASVSLRCELSKAAPVQWKRGYKVLKASDKYDIRERGTTAELVIHDLEVKDAGDYTCVCGDQKTTATLTVHGKKASLSLVNRSVDRQHSEIQLFLPWVGDSSLFLSLSSFVLYIDLILLRQKSKFWGHR